MQALKNYTQTRPTKLSAIGKQKVVDIINSIPGPTTTVLNIEALLLAKYQSETELDKKILVIRQRLWMLS